MFEQARPVGEADSEFGSSETAKERLCAGRLSNVRLCGPRAALGTQTMELKPPTLRGGRELLSRCLAAQVSSRAGEGGKASLSGNWRANPRLEFTRRFQEADSSPRGQEKFQTVPGRAARQFLELRKEEKRSPNRAPMGALPAISGFRDRNALGTATRTGRDKNLARACKLGFGKFWLGFARRAAVAKAAAGCPQNAARPERARPKAARLPLAKRAPGTPKKSRFGAFSAFTRFKG